MFDYLLTVADPELKISYSLPVQVKGRAKGDAKSFLASVAAHKDHPIGLRIPDWVEFNFRSTTCPLSAGRPWDPICAVQSCRALCIVDLDKYKDRLYTQCSYYPYAKSAPGKIHRVCAVDPLKYIKFLYKDGALLDGWVGKGGTFNCKEVCGSIPLRHMLSRLSAFLERNASNVFLRKFGKTKEDCEKFLEQESELLWKYLSSEGTSKPECKPSAKPEAVVQKTRIPHEPAREPVRNPVHNDNYVMCLTGADPTLVAAFVNGVCSSRFPHGAVKVQAAAKVIVLTGDLTMDDAIDVFTKAQEYCEDIYGSL